MAVRPVVGLDVGTSGVRAAQLSAGRGGLVLERFGQVALPVGAVRDGEVADPHAVAGALRQLWQQTRFSSRRVVLGVANQRVVVRQVDLPWMPLPELRTSLPFHVQDFLPMPVEQAILDVHPVSEQVDDTGARTMRVLLVAAARDMVSNLVAAVEEAGLDPVAVDLSSFAVLRSALTGAPFLGSSGAEALVDVGARVTNIVVHEGGVPRFVRILLMGGGDITDALCERLDVAPDEAELVKQAHALPDSAGAGDGSPVTRALEVTGGSFVEEVRSSLDYYAAQPGSARVSRVLLSGGGSRLGGLADRLAAALRTPVEPATPLAPLALGRTGLTPDQLAFVEPCVAVPVGLALTPALSDAA